ncbi:hypothetical protein FNV43_RR06863 [Rhamnella rubrinervis]|uniref:Uncharacterized protein n=1 Tax=Rhamnella rubrinervis TaxID=2594499 RepID=A0A8K0HEL6_9ROSA|nr:hypothetical protein FNV43_RR06863 [Rhamnella rubrinervis]
MVKDRVTIHSPQDIRLTIGALTLIALVNFYDPSPPLESSRRELSSSPGHSTKTTLVAADRSSEIRVRPTLFRPPFHRRPSKNFSFRRPLQYPGLPSAKRPNFYEMPLKVPNLICEAPP